MMRYLIILLLTASTWAQSSGDIERLSAEGEHFKAMVQFETLSRRRVTPEALIAVGKSAWALSLPQVAVEKLEAAIESADKAGTVIPPAERARVLFYRGIIEFQEERYQSASGFADRAQKLLAEPSLLRSKLLLLSGQSLAKLNRCGESESKFSQSAAEADVRDAPEAFLSLAQCQVTLGKYDEAVDAYKKIPIDNDRAPEAIRGLAELALRRDNDPEAGFWLSKGRELFPEQFVDSWVDYGLLRAAIAEKNTSRMKEIQENARKRLAPSDYWLTLLDALAEEAFWKERSL